MIADIKAEIARANDQLERLKPRLPTDDFVTLWTDLRELETATAQLSTDLPGRVLEIIDEHREEFDADLAPTLESLRAVNDDMERRLADES